MKVERIKRTLLDVGCTTVGLGVIIHQTLMVPPGKASEALLIAAVSILGIPAGVGLLSQAANGGTGTTGPLSSGPSPPSPAPSSTSPSPAPSGAGEPQ